MYCSNPEKQRSQYQYTIPSETINSSISDKAENSDLSIVIKMLMDSQNSLNNVVAELCATLKPLTNLNIAIQEDSSLKTKQFTSDNTSAVVHQLNTIDNNIKTNIADLNMLLEMLTV